MVKPKLGNRSPTRSTGDRDLVPDETSAAYKLVEHAAREGRRVSTKNMSDDEIRALLLGRRKDA